MLSRRAPSPAVLCSTAAACLLPVLLAKDPVTAKHGMLVAQEPVAADVGLAVLKNGGNAVDAAVAVGFALAVTHPVAGNLGGGGFMLIRMGEGRTDFLHFWGCAAGKGSRDMSLDKGANATKARIFGWRWGRVPGRGGGAGMCAHEVG